MKPLAIAIFLACAAFAQAPLNADKPVDAVVMLVPESVAPGGQGQLKVTLKIMEGGHANSNAPSDPNMIPTSLAAKPTPGIVWDSPKYPEAKTVTEWYAKEPLPVFLDGSVISIGFTVGKDVAAGPIAVSAVVQAQVCDHELCYPPRRFTVTAEVKVRK